VAVAKVAPGVDGPARGRREQEVLDRLAAVGLGAHVPAALGTGATNGVAWSAETFAAGVPLSATGRAWRRRHGRATLASLGDWLHTVATATAHPRPPGVTVAASAPLRGAARTTLGPALEAVGGAVSVLTHGDLASGENVLVRRASFTVVDWETATDDGLPLQDLLPTLALGLARIERRGTGAAGAEAVIGWGLGDGPEGEWLHRRVRALIADLGVPLDAAGPLAAIAWGYQASMRLRHDELVAASGAQPSPWTSIGELVFERWMNDERLGIGWTALRRGARDLR
jgi:hypothetical protein